MVTTIAIVLALLLVGSLWGLTLVCHQRDVLREELLILACQVVQEAWLDDDLRNNALLLIDEYGRKS